MALGDSQGTSRCGVKTADISIEANEEHADGYCGNLSCWCHTDVAYHGAYTSLGEASAEELVLAHSFFELA